MRTGRHSVSARDHEEGEDRMHLLSEFDSKRGSRSEDEEDVVDTVEEAAFMRQRDTLATTTTGQRASLVLLLVTLALACFASYHVLKLLYYRQTALHLSFAPPLIPVTQAVNSLADPFTGSESVQGELTSRLVSLGLAPSSIVCPWDTTIDPPLYSSLQMQGPYLIGLNLYNSAHIIPTLSTALLAVSTFLGPANVHISIFENGSTDKTKVALAHFARSLGVLGVEHTILSDDRATDWKSVAKIEQLAVYRNVIIEPLLMNRTEAFKSIIVLNDVFVCARDILELLREKMEQEADAVCAIDWRETRSWARRMGWNGVKLYDNWVARTIRGTMMRSRIDLLGEFRNGFKELFDQPGDEVSRDLFASGKPIPVFSCWNGMIALRAKPFIEDGIRFRGIARWSSECAASECKTLAKDFWRRGYNRWLMIPTVRVTYEESLYSHPQLIELSLERARDRIKIKWDEIVKPIAVICYGWSGRGIVLDIFPTLEPI